MTGRKTVEITAIVLREKFRREDFYIIEVQPIEGGKLAPWRMSVKGNLENPEEEFVPQLSYRFYGYIENHEKFGRTMAAKTFVRAQPHGMAGTVRYLQEAKNIGQAIAMSLWNKFGGDAVRILREEPEIAAAAVQGLTETKAREAASSLQFAKDLEDAKIDLIDCLDGYRFSKNLSDQCLRAWGNRAVEKIKRNPYLLMRFRGCGFGKTDQMYLQLGHNAARLKRQALCCWQVVAKDRDGHTWVPVEKLERGLRGKIAGAAVDPVGAVKLAIRAKLLAKKRDANGRLLLAEWKKAEAESRIAVAVARSFFQSVNWPQLDSSCGASEHQVEQFARATANQLGLLIGTPGTGKSYSSARLINALIEQDGIDQVAVAAPTNKAAVRITEIMRGYDVPIAATSIHRLLGVALRDDAGWAFVHNASNPLPYKWVIIDEASMIDVDLMADLLDAVSVGTGVLFVGDKNQLPPVGHGAPLRDLMEAGLPCGELTEVRRNSGTIVDVCRAIREKQVWVCDRALDPDNGKNLKLLEQRGADAILRAILDAVGSIRASGLVDPVEDVQVIVAINTKGSLNRRKFNEELQALLNPAAARHGDSPFRVGDKVVCLKNGFLKQAIYDPHGSRWTGEDEGGPFVANGEQGRVAAASEKWFVVEMKSPNRQVFIPRGKQDDDDSENEDGGRGCNWDLAYAVSAHKSQGSEWPVVLIPLDDYGGATGDFGICSREWIYTAISRAKRACLLVGQMQTARKMCSRSSLSTRRTLLVESIAEGKGRLLSHGALSLPDDEKASDDAGDNGDETPGLVAPRPDEPAIPESDEPPWLGDAQLNLTPAEYP